MTLARGLPAVELDHGADVGKGHVIGAARDLGDGIGRAIAAVDLHVDAGARKVAAFGRQHEGRLLALDGEIERELDGRRLRVAGRGKGGETRARHPLEPVK